MGYIFLRESKEKAVFAISTGLFCHQSVFTGDDFYCPETLVGRLDVGSFSCVALQPYSLLHKDSTGSPSENDVA